MVSWQMMKEQAELKVIKGHIVASLTDEYIVDVWPDMKNNTLEGKEHKLLEARIFDTNQEIKLFRTSISKEFKLRHIDDRVDKRDYEQESQFLDIDTKKSEKSFKKSHEVYATGGGKYYLPLKKMQDAKVLIRYYYECYEDSGQARVCDWRLVGFEEGK